MMYMGVHERKNSPFFYFYALTLGQLSVTLSLFAADAGETTLYVDELRNDIEQQQEVDAQYIEKIKSEDSVAIQSMDKNFLYPVDSVAGGEKQPSDISSFLQKGKVPNYVKISISNYNIRKTPEFESAKTDNIDIKSEKGSLFAVTRVQPLERGVAVGIFVDGDERWIYVPNWRKKDFLFCETEACYEAISQVLNLLQSDSSVKAEPVKECLLPAAEEASYVAESSYIPTGKIPVPERRREKYIEHLDKRIPRESYYYRPLMTKPLWEKAHPGEEGRRLTRMARESLALYGQDLLQKMSLRDQSYWCPNYSELSRSEREEFWIHLLNGMAKYESGFDYSPPPFDEKLYDNVKHGRIDPEHYSMGLFALSYHGTTKQDAYKRFCKFSWSRDKYKDVSDPLLTIHDPQKQMDCAVGMLNHLVKQNGVIGRTADQGGARWWAVLRATNLAESRGIQSSLRRFRPCWQ